MCGRNTSRLARLRTKYVQVARPQSTSSEDTRTNIPRAPSARTGFRQGLHAWCSLRVSVVALLSRGTCACLPTPELVRRSPPKHLPPALRSVRTTLSVRSIAVAHMQTFRPGTAALGQSNGLFRDSFIFVPPHRSKRVAAARTRCSALPRSQWILIQPANKLTERSSFDLRIYCT